MYISSCSNVTTKQCWWGRFEQQYWDRHWVAVQHNCKSFCKSEALLLLLLVERPALAVRLDLSFRSVYFFFFLWEYLPNRWTYLNKSLHGDGKWLGIEHGGFHFLNFWGGLGWGPKKSLFARICPEWPSQNTIWRQNVERYQKSKTVLFWPDNFIT